MLRLLLLALGVCVAACSRERDPQELVEIVVASEDLAVGAPVQLESISRRLVPAQMVSENCVRPSTAQQAIGRTTLIALRRGDPLLHTALGPDLTSLGLADRVDDQARAFWVEISTPVPLSEVLRRGDRVDLMANVKDPITFELVSANVGQNFEVLDARPKALALQLTPRDAQRLALLQDTGFLSVSIRSKQDAAQVDAGTVNLRSALEPGGR